MFSLADMKYFIHPVATRNVDAPTAVFVTGTLYGARDATLLNKVVKVRADTSLEQGRLWYTTVEGDRVTGFPANRTDLNRGSWVVGSSPAFPGLFFSGVGRVQDNRGMPIFVLSGHVVRSDGARRSDGSDWIGVTLTEWFQAADYAGDMLRRVRPGVNDEELRTLVQKRWSFNRALSIIEAEGVSRGWGADLEGLHEDFDWMPRFTGAVHHSLTALVPAGRTQVTNRDALIEHHRLRNQIAGRSGGVVPQEGDGLVYLNTAVNFITYGGESISNGMLSRSTTPENILQALRDRFGVWDVTYLPAHASSRPFINGVHHSTNLV